MTEKQTEETTAANGHPEERRTAVEEEVLGDKVRRMVDKAVKSAIEAVKQPADNQTRVTDAHQEGEKPQGQKWFQDATQSRPHAFVVMPFGVKKGTDGKIYDFNAIYNDLIKPAVELAGFDPFRADEETVSGDILTDMFQELLLADLVICDMSIDNANVFYEMGVRHAFRKRGVVHIQAGRSYMPFDVFNVRTIPYETTEAGLPNPETREKDIQNIARVARDTWASDLEAVHSPIFNLLSGLDEPDRKQLRTPLATGFWREHNDWKQRVTVARRRKRIGDILVLTEEISNPLIKEEAIGEAGAALKSMGRHELALQQYRQGLKLNPKNHVFQREEALHLNRVGRVDEAIVRLENYLERYPWDSEAIGTLGRIYKDMWQDCWRGISDPEERRRQAFEAYHWLIKAFSTYIKGYHYNLNDIYPGINAHTMATILEHLAEQFDDPEDPDPDIVRVLDLLPNLRATLVFTLEEKATQEKIDYWSLVSLAETRLFTASKPVEVTRAYRKALIAARKNTFFLQSSKGQLEMLQSLGLRAEYIATGIQAIDAEIERIEMDRSSEGADNEEKPPYTRVQAILFAGHAPDVGERKPRRFPPELEPEVREQIAAVLDKLVADGNDTAFTAGAAAGGTIIFIEECLLRGLDVEIHLPYAEPDYLKQFVSPHGDAWTERYYALRNHNKVSIRLQADHIGPIKAGANPHERNNRWALYSSLLLGIDHVRLVALWDGQVSCDDLDGQLVSDMVEKMRRMGGIVEHINTTKFKFWMKGRSSPIKKTVEKSGAASTKKTPASRPASRKGSGSAKK